MATTKQINAHRKAVSLSRFKPTVSDELSEELSGCDSIKEIEKRADAKMANVKITDDYWNEFNNEHSNYPLSFDDHPKVNAFISKFKVSFICLSLCVIAFNTPPCSQSSP